LPSSFVVWLKRRHGRLAMKFLLMITDIEGMWDRLAPAEQARVLEGHGEFGRALRAEGKFLHSHRLRPCREAKTVRIEESTRIVTDGPFAETKEVMGGFYVIECATMDEAVAWGKRLPSMYGSIEVRPIWE
jgi:hypothetical protein